MTAILERIEAHWEWVRSRSVNRKVEAAIIDELLQRLIAKDNNFKRTSLGKDIKFSFDEKEIKNEIILMLNEAIRDGNTLKLTQDIQKNTLIQKLLNGFLDYPLTFDEIEDIILRQSSLGLSYGTIMAFLKKNYLGRFDEKLACDMARNMV
jgi:hypothetical protein